MFGGVPVVRRPGSVPPWPPLLALSPLWALTSGVSSGVAFAPVCLWGSGVFLFFLGFLAGFSLFLFVTCITLFFGCFVRVFGVCSLFFLGFAILLVLLVLVCVPRGTGIDIVCRLCYTCVVVGGVLVWSGGRVAWLPPAAVGSCCYGFGFCRLFWCVVSFLCWWGRCPCWLVPGCGVTAGGFAGCVCWRCCFWLGGVLRRVRCGLGCWPLCVRHFVAVLVSVVWRCLGACPGRCCRLPGWVCLGVGSGGRLAVGRYGSSWGARALRFRGVLVFWRAALAAVVVLVGFALGFGLALAWVSSGGGVPPVFLLRLLAGFLAVPFFFLVVLPPLSFLWGGRS